MFLEAVRILNYKTLVAKSLHMSGYVENNVEGRIKILKEAHIWNGQFINQGRVKGVDGSVLIVTAMILSTKMSMARPLMRST